MTEHQLPMTALDHECIVFTEYLIQNAPNAYVLSKYRDAHVSSIVFRNLSPSTFDLILLGLADLHPWALALVDSYSSVLFRSSAVRKKMVLLIAILESCSPSHIYFDKPESKGLLSFALKMFWQGCIFAINLLLGIVLLLPIHLLFGLSTKLAGWSSERMRPSLARVPFLVSTASSAQTRAKPAELPPDMPLSH
jgi:hypothetical protein